MPELATPKVLGLNPSVFQPISPASYFNRTPIPPPEVDTSEASKLAGKAALYGALGKVLAELPKKLVDSYTEGRNLAVGNQVTRAYNDAFTNKTQDLANFSATSEGDVKFSPQDAEERRLRLAVLAHQSMTPYEQDLAAFKAMEASRPSTSASGGISVKTLPLPDEPLPNQSSELDPTATGFLPPSGFQPTGTDASRHLSEFYDNVATMTPAQQKDVMSRQVAPLPTASSTAPPVRPATPDTPSTHEVLPDGRLRITYSNGTVMEKFPGVGAWKDVTPTSPEKTRKTQIIAQQDEEGKVHNVAVTIDEKTGNVVKTEEIGVRKQGSVLKPTATVSQRVTDGINAIEGLQEVLKERKKKPELNAAEKIALVQQSKPSNGMLDSLARQAAQAFIPKEAMELETLRNRVNSMIIFARGGSALTESEKAALTIVEPDDSKEAAITKINTAIPILKKELRTYAEQYPGSFPALNKLIGEDDTIRAAPQAPATNPPLAKPLAPDGMILMTSPDGKITAPVRREMVQKYLARGATITPTQ